MPIERPQGQLRMWFERRGSAPEDGWVSQDYRGDPIDLERVRRQAVIEGGPLFGSFAFSDADDALIAELRLRKFGAPLGLELAQTFVRSVINPHFVRAVASIRHLLGQYWLEPLYPWDGNVASLGAYCQHLQMHWKTDADEQQVFCPSVPTYTSNKRGSGNPYVQLPDEDRWLEIVVAVEQGYEPSPASQALVRAHALRERGDARLAFVEATTALEIAVNEKVRSAFRGSQEVSAAAQSFHGIPLSARLAIVAAFHSIPSNDIALCLKGYSQRNGIAHEGKLEDVDSAAALDAMLRVARTLLPGPHVAYPTRQTANEQRRTNTEWDALPTPKYDVAITTASRPPGFTPWTDTDSSSFRDNDDHQA